jgi:hypothetical protein
MNAQTTTFRLHVGLILATCLIGTVSANVLYTYTGNTFNFILDGAVPTGSYETSMNVTGMFELSEALPPDALGERGGYYQFSPLAFSFNDGLMTIDSNDTFAWQPSFTVLTDSSGNITAWNIFLRVDETGPGIVTHTINTYYHPEWPIEPGFPNAVDSGRLEYCEAEICASFVGRTDLGRVVNTPGTFSMNIVESPTPSVPEPSTFALFGIGLLALLKRRFGFPHMQLQSF